MTKIIHGLFVCLAFLRRVTESRPRLSEQSHHHDRAVCGRRTDGYRGAIDRRADEQDAQAASDR